MVKLANGCVLRRHCNHLRKRFPDVGDNYTDIGDSLVWDGQVTLELLLREDPVPQRPPQPEPQQGP